MRNIQTSVNNFIHCGDEYLFVLRDKNKSVDANRLNSIGGKVEPGENYLDCLIRETQEEAGIPISPEDTQFVGLLRLEGGYKDDWVAGLFKTEVETKVIKHGTVTPEGTFLWIHKDKVLSSEHELVDDLNHIFKEIVSGDGVFFANAIINEHEKVEKISISKIPMK